MLALRVVRVQNGSNDSGCGQLEVGWVALEVRGNHDVRSLEARVGSEGFKQLSVFIDILNVVLKVRNINPPKLDPSPASGGDDPRDAVWEGLT
jgi:hypothetical protein